MLGINPPTAYLMLTDYVKLQAGRVGDPESRPIPASGVLLIGSRKRKGLKTVNVVRRDDVVAELKAAGGDVVLVDGPDLAKRVATETGGAQISLAIDGVADTATANLIGCLAPKGTLVFYSAISGKPFIRSGAALHLPRHRNPRLLARQLVQQRKRRPDHRDV